MILPNNIPTGKKFISYLFFYRVIPVGYSGFRYRYHIWFGGRSCADVLFIALRIRRPFSPSRPPPMHQREDEAIAGLAGLLCQSGLVGLVRAQYGHPFSFFPAYFFSLFSQLQFRCPPLRALSLSLSPVATTGRPPPPPYSRCPDHCRVVFLGPFAGDEHPSTPTTFSSLPVMRNRAPKP
jgi:hypothetical protein